MALTARGQAAFQRIGALAREINAQVTIFFGPDELAALRNLLDRAISAADAPLPPGPHQDDNEESRP